MGLLEEIFRNPMLAMLSGLCIGMAVGALVTVAIFNNWVSED